MRFHVLTDDALAADFRKTNVYGENIVCRRECPGKGDLPVKRILQTI